MRSPGRRYRDRSHAGQILAGELARYAGRSDVLVLALPRGGVPVAAPVAVAWSAPLDVLLVRKLGVPGQPELAMGALALVGGRVELVRNESVITATNVSAEAFAECRSREEHELERRRQLYPGWSADVAGRVLVLVDDGLATGSTMLAAVRAVRAQQPAEIVVAVPVAAAQAVAAVTVEADTVVCPWVPQRFGAVGLAYADFSQVADAEVARLLSRS